MVAGVSGGKLFIIVFSGGVRTSAQFGLPIVQQLQLSGVHYIRPKCRLHLMQNVAVVGCVSMSMPLISL